MDASARDARGLSEREPGNQRKFPPHSDINASRLLPTEHFAEWSDYDD